MRFTLLLFALLAASGHAGRVAFRDFPDGRVFQRDVAQRGAWVTLQGEAEPGLDSMEVRIVLDSNWLTVQPWKRLRIASNRFHDSLFVPQGGWYRVLYKAHPAGLPEEIQYSGKWGVGMNILCIGQSNMSGRAEGPYRAASELAGLYGNDGQWVPLSDPYDRNGSTGQIDNDQVNAKYSMMPALSHGLAGLGFPVGIVPAAKGSTAMAGDCDKCWSYRDSANHKNTKDLYGNSISKVDSVGGVELLLLHQGEKDVGIGYGSYRAAFEKMLAQYREDVSPSLPVFYCRLGNLSAPTDSAYHAIQQAQQDVADGILNVIIHTDDLEVSPPDFVHFTAAGLDTIGERLAQAILSRCRAQGSCGEAEYPVAVPPLVARVRAATARAFTPRLVNGRAASLVRASGAVSFLP